MSRFGSSGEAKRLDGEADGVMASLYLTMVLKTQVAGVGCGGIQGAVRILFGRPVAGAIRAEVQERLWLRGRSHYLLVARDA